MTSDDRLRRILYGIQRQFGDTPARSARAEATIRRVKPWLSGRIGKIEKHISREGACGGRDKLLTTGELARAIYANPTWDQDFNLRKEGEKPPKLKSWQYDRVRRAAPTFADCVGRSTGPGRPWLWRVRSDQFWWNVRRAKTERDKARRSCRATRARRAGNRPL